MPLPGLCLIHQAHVGGPICLYLSLGRENCWSQAWGRLGYGGPASPQRLLEAWALSTGVRREWTFCLALYSDRLALASVLAQGSEQQPCSHTSCATAKALHPQPPTVRGREAFLTFFPEKRGEMSEFGGHHVIQIAI